MNTFNVKPKIYFDTGSLKYLNDLKSEKVCIITDSFILKAGFVDKITSILDKKNISYEIFSDVKPDPGMDIIEAGINIMQSHKPDTVIAIGGGSSIDAAKSILMLTRKILNKKGEDCKKPFFIAIPTTSGTGSEVTSFSVVTVNGKKVTLIYDELVPDVAIIDADFVKTVPPKITADTGIDALTHGIEAYVSTQASDYTDALAEKSIKIIFDYLLKAYRDGNDIIAREKLHNASCMAGMAFTNASVGINHSMAHTLGANFHISHGRANAILLPYVIRYNANLESNIETRAALRYRDIAQILGLPCDSVRQGVESLICAIEVILQETHVPMNLKDANVDKEQFLGKLSEMADTALKDRCTVTNPRNTSKQDIIELFKIAYEK